MPYGFGLQIERVEAGIRFGDGETGFVVPRDQGRQHANFLLVTTEHHHRIEPENIHMQCRGAREAGARFSDGLHHDSGLGYAEARAAVYLRDRDAKPALLSEGAVEILWEATFAILGEPVVVGKASADLLDCRSDCL